MTYGDAGSNFQAAAGSGSDPLPQLRPQDVGDDVPATPSNFGQVLYDRSSDQAGRQDEERQADQRVQVGGSPAGVDVGVEPEAGSKACRYVVEPPNLAEWRQRLFDLEETVVMTNTEFETYFPHVDNVYSHRSTQRYKRKPFVSSYWDCRLKGRPPGTPKSTDPNKRRRKRQGRGLDLCDVKIKIVEYAAPSAAGGVSTGDLPEEVLSVFRGAGEHGGKVWTIQRVCGFGSVERKGGGGAGGSGTPARHKHVLEKSDAIKKNSVLRWVAAREKEAKKAATAVRPVGLKATGLAALTVGKRSREADLKLYSSCWCPFSQRVWIALEAKGLAYQYYETDPFKAPRATGLPEARPRRTVPAIKHREWACGESRAILEYLEELEDSKVRLLPMNPQGKADCRLWINFINDEVVPAFYALLAAVGEAAQSAAIEKLQGDIASLVQVADERGPYFLGGQMSLVDIHLAPFVVRMSRILQPFRGWMPPVPERWQVWVDAIESNVHVRNTVSAERLYAETVDLLVKGRQPVLHG